MQHLPILIWAGNLYQARKFINFHNLATNEVVIISPDDPHKIKGINKGVVIRIGTWCENKNAEDFELRLLSQRLIITNDRK